MLACFGFCLTLWVWLLVDFDLCITLMPGFGLWLLDRLLLVVYFVCFVDCVLIWFALICFAGLLFIAL